MRRRSTAAAAVIAIASYFLWIAAAADDFGGSGMWTILAGVIFWSAVVALVALVGAGVLSAFRSKR